MHKTCKNCSAEFEITNEDLKFYDKVSPVFNGKKYVIPPPKLCPVCRMQRRYTHRNDRSLYRSVSSLSNAPMITMYAPQYGFTVYEQHEWWSDAWEPKEYGRDFDFSRPFFKQFQELQKKLSRFNVFNRDTENCDYVNYAPHSKNCYLLFGSWFNEDCMYGQMLSECKDSMENLFLFDHSELCYENVDCSENYRAFFCQNSSKVTESWFCFDCKNVEHCIGCYNLRNKKYHLENKPVSKEDYEKIQNEFSSFQKLQEYKEKFRILVRNKVIHESIRGYSNENVSGDLIFNCKNAKFCFSTYRCEDIAYSSRAMEVKDSYDFEGGGKGQLLYENMSNDFSYFSISCTTGEYLQNTHYSDLCFNCSNCFGCIGLRHEQYCILNKQYSKEEYEKLVSRIIEHMQKSGEWGEFFPIQMSPFAYNETIAEEYFPMTKEEVLTKGWKWKDQERFHALGVMKKIPASKLPDSIIDIPDDILNWAIQCEESGKLFKIQKAELEFYRKMNLPIPHYHPDIRHAHRMALRNPRKLWNRNCAKCQKEIQTTYDPERPEIVYCEECYLAEVY
ncbi:hypothetical protein HZA38_05635 [Candidatus Peregrinibacteria bacterium]|nr:hypothetical protein [Candidatus Peregrinibacteria bacterium]